MISDAFILLSESGRFPGLRLRATGGATSADAPFLRDLRHALSRHGLLSRFDFVRPFDRKDRAEFLRSLTVLSVPVPVGQASGAFLLEAMACGVPVVEPRLGGFTELIEATACGVFYEPNTPEKLASAIGGLLEDRGLAGRLGTSGRQAVMSGYTAGHMAEGLERVMEEARERARGRQ